MPANILNLAVYAVTALSQDEHDYHIATEIKEPPKVCPQCRSDRIVGFGRRKQLVKDLPIHGKRVGIYPVPVSSLRGLLGKRGHSCAVGLKKDGF